MLRDVSDTRSRDQLFLDKLRLCCVMFDWESDLGTLASVEDRKWLEAQERGKEEKKRTLLELVDFSATEEGKRFFGSKYQKAICQMLAANLFRDTPPTSDEYDPEEDEPCLEPAWPHLTVVYEYLLRFIVSSATKAKDVKRTGAVDQKFLMRLM